MTVVLVTIAATLMIQVGYFLWKLSADGQPKIGGAPFKKIFWALVTDWRWMSGFVATSLGWLLFVQATALGDISLIQPLMSAGDFFLVLLAVVFLKEQLQYLEWGGVLVTVLGAVFLTLDATLLQTAPYDQTRLFLLLGFLVLIGGLMFANRSKSFVAPEVLLALVVGLCFGAGATLTKAMTAQISAQGASLTQAKSWMLLIDPLLPAVIIANVLGLIFLQAAFQRGRAAVIVPLQLAMANAVTVVAGVFVFSENITFFRAIGIALILGGTVLLQL